MEDRSESCVFCKRTLDEAAMADGSDIIPVIRAEGDRLFSYGMAGYFKFDEPQPMKDGDQMCQACMKARPFKEYLGAVCAICGVGHRVIFAGEEISGDGCCGHVTRDDRGERLSCGYGSRNDCTSFPIVKLDLPSGSLVCDSCIDTLLSEGRILPGNNPLMDEHVIPIGYGVPEGGEE